MFGETRLENGIRVVSESMAQTRSVALGIMVEVGTQNEPATKAGIAHLAEHLFFQGTSSRSAGEIALLMDRAGGSIGAFTSRDYTFFGACVLDDYLPYAMELMSDMLLNAIFPETRLNLEKQSILAELARADDDPQASAHDALKAYAWGNHPLGRPIGGTPQSVQGLSREDLIYFVYQNYLPDRIIVAGAGHIQHEEFAAQVRDGFWRMIGQSARHRTLYRPRFRSGVTLRDRDFSQIYFCLGIPALEYVHQDRSALHLLSKVLGGGLSSRFYANLREQKGWVYYVSTEYHAYRDTGMFIIEGCAPPERFGQVITSICETLTALARGDQPIGIEELNTAQMSLRGQHILESESTQTRMTRLATQSLYFGRPLGSEQVLDDLMRQTPESMNHFVQNFLAEHLSQCALSVAGPCQKENIDIPLVASWMDQARTR